MEPERARDPVGPGPEARGPSGEHRSSRRPNRRTVQRPRPQAGHAPPGRSGGPALRPGRASERDVRPGGRPGRPGPRMQRQPGRRGATDGRARRRRRHASVQRPRVRQWLRGEDGHARVPVRRRLRPRPLRCRDRPARDPVPRRGGGHAHGDGDRRVIWRRGGRLRRESRAVRGDRRGQRICRRSRGSERLRSAGRGREPRGTLRGSPCAARYAAVPAHVHHRVRQDR